jgi:hypothetical protein
VTEASGGSRILVRGWRFLNDASLDSVNYFRSELDSVLFVLSFLVLFIYNEFRTNNFIDKKVQQEHLKI